MPNNKVKTLKGIKGKDTAHPFSRKAYQMRRAVHREQRLDTQQDKSKHDKQRRVDRLMFFKDFVPEPLVVLTLPEMHVIVKHYLSRFDEELAELTASIRPNRPKPVKIEKLELLKRIDEAEYRTGFEMPDFMNQNALHLFNLWTGDYNGLPAIKLIHIEEKSLVEQI